MQRSYYDTIGRLHLCMSSIVSALVSIVNEDFSVPACTVMYSVCCPSVCHRTIHGAPSLFHNECSLSLSPPLLIGTKSRSRGTSGSQASRSQRTCSCSILYVLLCNIYIDIYMEIICIDIYIEDICIQIRNANVQNLYSSIVRSRHWLRSWFVLGK